MEITASNTIVCWGDSLTEGMGMWDKSYPVRLQEKLGDNYKVLNGGDGGENTVTIMARQGANKLFTCDEIIFKAGESEVVIGNQDNNGFVTEDNEKIKFTLLKGNKVPINEITICGEKFTLSLVDFIWKPITYTAILKRQDVSSDLIIPKGTQVVLNNTDISKKGGIDIYLMGANGGFDDSGDKLVEQYRKMIKYHGSDRFIIIAPFWTTEYNEVLTKAFGEHLVYYREAVLERGLQFENIEATEEDKERMKNGLIPVSFCFQNKPDLHLNEHGYHFLAQLVYEKGKELKLFN